MDEREQAEHDSMPLSNGDNGLPEARDAKGRFLRGNPGGPGNPNARNVATWRRALADSVSPEDVGQVAQKLLEAAKAGEPWAVREFFDRCLGKPHVQVDLSANLDGPNLLRPLTEAEQDEARRIARVMIESGAVNLPAAMQGIIIAELQGWASPQRCPGLANQ